jgi:hypothetical protein
VLELQAPSAHAGALAARRKWRADLCRMQRPAAGTAARTFEELAQRVRAVSHAD